MTPQDLLDFEAEIADCFAKGLIKSPVHLSEGNEQHLIDLFKRVDLENDYLACGWRSHYHCLLAGVPPEELKAAILAGHSIALCFPKYRVISSAIVGGIAPIAMGIAWGLKRSGKPGKVWVFMGDMTARTGIVSETMRYAHGHELPISFVTEDNGKSVCTDTKEVWGKNGHSPYFSYRYELTRPHVGIGKFVSF
jgi:TPP-dependent pyruvate/acetoin dehydrogenase alpha subunit